MNQANRNTIRTMRCIQSLNPTAKVSFINVSPPTFNTNYGRQFGPCSPKKRKRKEVERSNSEPMPVTKATKVDVSIKNVDYNDGGTYHEQGVVHNTLSSLSQIPLSLSGEADIIKTAKVAYRDESIGDDVKVDDVKVVDAKGDDDAKEDDAKEDDAKGDDDAKEDDAKEDDAKGDDDAKEDDAKQEEDAKQGVLTKKEKEDIKELLKEDEPQTFLLVDESGSMDDHIDEVRKLIRDTLENFRGFPVTSILYSGNSKTKLNIKTFPEVIDDAAILKILNAYSPGGGTPLYHVVNGLYLKEIKDNKGKVALINISDGADNMCNTNDREHYEDYTKAMRLNPNQVYINHQVVKHVASDNVIVLPPNGDSQMASSSIMRSFSYNMSQPTSQPTMVQQTSH